jgi:hypothetical protein
MTSTDLDLDLDSRRGLHTMPTGTVTPTTVTATTKPEKMDDMMTTATTKKSLK